MNCDEVRDLTGAYALGSVSPEEKRQIEDHLEDCDLHDEIAGLTATAMGLASTSLELESPAGLGGRISAAIHAEPDVVVTRPVDRPIWRRVTRIASWPVAAALVVAVGALVIWKIDLQLEDLEDNSSISGRKPMETGYASRRRSVTPVARSHWVDLNLCRQIATTSCGP